MMTTEQARQHALILVADWDCSDWEQFKDWLTEYLQENFEVRDERSMSEVQQSNEPDTESRTL